MFKFILPTILIGVSITGFFLFTKPFYEDINSQREQIASYNEALNNSKSLEAERDKLTQKYNSFKDEDLNRLNKLLPDSVDNIRLILEIEKIAAPYGMVLKDIKYNTENKNNTINNNTGSNTNNIKQSNKEVSDNKDYGTWDLEFSTEGSYNNFINLVKDLENNLRIVDVSIIQFTSNADTGPKKNSASESYKYGFKIKTYWLKN